MIIAAVAEMQAAWGLIGVDAFFPKSNTATRALLNDFITRSGKTLALVELSSLFCLVSGLTGHSIARRSLLILQLVTVVAPIFGSPETGGLLCEGARCFKAIC